MITCYNIDNARDQVVRLIGGNNSREGIVEIAYGGRWGMVCNTNFGQTDARSICRGLGFDNGDATVISTRYISASSINSAYSKVDRHNKQCNLLIITVTVNILYSYRIVPGPLYRLFLYSYTSTKLWCLET